MRTEPWGPAGKGLGSKDFICHEHMDSPSTATISLHCVPLVGSQKKATSKLGSLADSYLPELGKITKPVPLAGSNLLLLSLTVFVAKWSPRSGLFCSVSQSRVTNVILFLRTIHKHLTKPSVFSNAMVPSTINKLRVTRNILQWRQCSCFGRAERWIQ